MIEIPISPHYKNPVGSHAEFCISCGRPIKAKDKIHYLRIWYGSHAVKKDEIQNLDPSGDSGYHPIGPSCFKKNPNLKEYEENGS